MICTYMMLFLDVNLDTKQPPITAITSTVAVLLKKTRKEEASVNSSGSSHKLGLLNSTVSTCASANGIRE